MILCLKIQLFKFLIVYLNNFSIDFLNHFHHCNFQPIQWIVHVKISQFNYIKIIVVVEQQVSKQFQNEFFPLQFHVIFVLHSQFIFIDLLFLNIRFRDSITIVIIFKWQISSRKFIQIINFFFHLFFTFYFIGLTFIYVFLFR